jgi:DNA-3-methyladenine glycosylase
MGEFVLNENLKALTEDFYLRPTVEVARDLIGKTLIRNLKDPRSETWKTLAGEIVETEAYLQEGDPASHSRYGPTPRNRAMFGEPGRAYVYFIYGTHFCFNVVTQEKGIGEAVLIRAIRPLWGEDLMRENRLKRGRLRKGLQRECDLSNGPGKLCQAMLIDKSLDSQSLLSLRGGLFISDLTSKVFSGLSRKTEKRFSQGEGRRVSKAPLGRSQRVGISRGSELLYRFFQQECEWVSS